MTRPIYYRAELTWAELTQADLTQGRLDRNSMELPHGFKTFILSIFEWPLKTGSLDVSYFSLKMLFVVLIGNG